MIQQNTKVYLLIGFLFVIGCAILGLSYYSVQVNKQRSIEYQQGRELEAMRAIEDSKQDQLAKEFIAAEKASCLKIYQTEGSKWSNVTGWRYAEDNNTCYIEYKEDSQKADVDCDIMYPIDTDTYGYFNFQANILCKNGRFEKAF